MASILVIDPDPGSRDAVVAQLAAHDHRTEAAASAGEAETVLARSAPELVVLEWTLPDVSGLELVTRLKSHEAAPRVIMLSHRDDVRDVVRALDAGVDDYVIKPWHTAELLARVRAALRRPGTLQSEDVMRIGAVEMDRLAHAVRINGEPASLAPTEYRLLEYLMVHPRRVHSRQQLLHRVWGRRGTVSPRTVDVHVRRLRQLLEPHGLEQMIQTIRGFGYRLQPPARKARSARNSSVHPTAPQP